MPSRSRASDDAGVALGDREREHADEVVDAAGAPAVVGLEHHLGVRGREEAVAGGLQLLAQLLVVVDAAVEDQRQPEVAVDHRLRAARGQVDDRQPPVPERDRPVRDDAVGVGAARRHGIGHPGHGGDVGRPTVEADLSADTAHVASAPYAELGRSGCRSVSRCPCCRRPTTSSRPGSARRDPGQPGRHDVRRHRIAGSGRRCTNARRSTWCGYIPRRRRSGAWTARSPPGRCSAPAASAVRAVGRPTARARPPARSPRRAAEPVDRLGHQLADVVQHVVTLVTFGADPGRHLLQGRLLPR